MRLLDADRGRAPSMSFKSKTLLTAALLLLGGCSDVNGLVLESVEVRVGTAIVESVAVADVGTTTITGAVPRAATFLLAYDEPVDLPSAREHILLRNEAGSTLPCTIAAEQQKLSLVPAQSLATGRSHLIKVEPGVEDVADNATGYTRTIVFSAE